VRGDPTGPFPAAVNGALRRDFIAVIASRLSIAAQQEDLRALLGVLIIVYVRVRKVIYIVSESMILTAGENVGEALKAEEVAWREAEELRRVLRDLANQQVARVVILFQHHEHSEPLNGARSGDRLVFTLFKFSLAANNDVMPVIRCNVLKPHRQYWLVLIPAKLRTSSRASQRDLLFIRRRGSPGFRVVVLLVILTLIAISNVSSRNRSGPSHAVWSDRR